MPSCCIKGLFLFLKMVLCCCAGLDPLNQDSVEAVQYSHGVSSYPYSTSILERDIRDGLQTLQLFVDYSAGMKAKGIADESLLLVNLNANRALLSPGRTHFTIVFSDQQITAVNLFVNLRGKTQDGCHAESKEFHWPLSARTPFGSRLFEESLVAGDYTFELLAFNVEGDIVLSETGRFEVRQLIPLVGPGTWHTGGTESCTVFLTPSHGDLVHLRSDQDCQPVKLSLSSCTRHEHPAHMLRVLVLVNSIPQSDTTTSALPGDLVQESCVSGFRFGVNNITVRVSKLQSETYVESSVASAMVHVAIRPRVLTVTDRFEDSGSKVLVSLVLAARNDDYGKDFVVRLQSSIDMFCERVIMENVSAEVLIVEYNQVAGNKPLSELLTQSRTHLQVPVQILTVPSTVHERVLSHFKTRDEQNQRARNSECRDDAEWRANDEDTEGCAQWTREGCRAFVLQAAEAWTAWLSDCIRSERCTALPTAACCACKNLLGLDGSWFAGGGPEMVLPVFQGVANNIGARRARGQFLLFAGADMMFSPNVFKMLQQNILRSDVFYRLRGRVEVQIPNQGPSQSRAATLQDWMSLIEQHSLSLPPCQAVSHPVPLTDASGDFILVSRKAINAVSGFPELPIFLHSDSYLVMRLLSGGYAQMLLEHGVAYHQWHPSRGRANAKVELPGWGPNVDLKLHYRRMMFGRQLPVDLRDVKGPHGENWGFPDLEFAKTQPRLKDEACEDGESETEMQGWSAGTQGARQAHRQESRARLARWRAAIGDTGPAVSIVVVAGCRQDDHGPDEVSLLQQTINLLEVVANEMHLRYEVIVADIAQPANLRPVPLSSLLAAPFGGGHVSVRVLQLSQREHTAAKETSFRHSHSPAPDAEQSTSDTGSRAAVARNAAVLRARGSTIVFLQVGQVLSRAAVADMALRSGSSAVWVLRAAGRLNFGSLRGAREHARLLGRGESKQRAREPVKIHASEGGGDTKDEICLKDWESVVVASRDAFLAIGRLDEAGTWADGRGRWGNLCLVQKFQDLGRAVQIRALPCAVYHLLHAETETAGTSSAIRSKGCGEREPGGGLHGVDRRQWKLDDLIVQETTLVAAVLQENDGERGTGNERSRHSREEAHLGAVLGVNFADVGGVWEHHWAIRYVVQILRLQGAMYEVQRDAITEFTGLVVPVQYDCWNMGAGWDQDDDKEEQAHAAVTYVARPPPALSRAHPYFLAVPHRWHACNTHHSKVLSGQRFAAYELPVIDEEYLEAASVYESVLSACHAQFSIVEVGARWGTWGLRALALVKRLGEGVSGHALFFEVDGLACEACRAALHLNGLGDNGTVHCRAGDADVIREFAQHRGWLDVVDMDIQGEELSLLPELMDTLRTRVRRVIVGTHSEVGHAQVRDMFAGWTVVSELPWRGETQCNQLLRSEQKWEAQERLAAECYFEQTEFGPILPWDGELIVDNPSASFASVPCDHAGASFRMLPQ